jgi:hypothetical protein
VETAAQPIAVDDVIEYLVGAVTLEPGATGIFEIGGGDRMSYAEVMREYARQRNLRRPLIHIPLITPSASRRFLGVLTPRHSRIVGAMLDSMRNETVVRDLQADEAFSVEPRGLSEAIEGALAAEDRDLAKTHWSQAVSSTSKSRLGGTKHGRRLVSSRVVLVKRRPNIAFARIERLGGATGWYALNWFWTLRGLLDELRGGVGLRRGRRHPRELRVGDAVDFWRVELVDPGHRLLLSAEMKLPGRLWLEFEVKPERDGARIHQTTVFDPAGYIGRAYWYLLYPVHDNIFRAMLHGLRRATIAAPSAAG